MIETQPAAPALRRRREIEFLSRELIQQARDLLTTVAGMAPADLAALDDSLAEGTPMRLIADRLDSTRLCFELLREEIGTGKAHRSRPIG